MIPFEVRYASCCSNEDPGSTSSEAAGLSGGTSGEAGVIEPGGTTGGAGLKDPGSSSGEAGLRASRSSVTRLGSARIERPKLHAATARHIDMHMHMREHLAELTCSSKTHLAELTSMFRGRRFVRQATVTRKYSSACGRALRAPAVRAAVRPRTCRPSSRVAPITRKSSSCLTSTFGPRSQPVMTSTATFSSACLAARAECRPRPGCRR